MYHRAKAIILCIGLWPLCAVSPCALAQHATETLTHNESERFALLVGINDYAPNPDGQPQALKGPANDVGLMRELLVTRYEFKDDPSHVAVLVGSEATRKPIIDAFKKQLIDNAAAHPMLLLCSILATTDPKCMTQVDLMKVRMTRSLHTTAI